MDLTKLKNRPLGAIVGGGFNTVYFAVDEWLVDGNLPERNTDNKAVISTDVVFKTGYGWTPLYMTTQKQKFIEKQSDKADNDNVTKTFTGFHPGFKEAFRQFVAEYGKKKLVFLVYKDGEDYPFMIGQRNNFARLSVESDSGESGDDDAGNKLTAVFDGPYLAPIYKGAFNPGETILAANATTLDASKGSYFLTAANTAATALAGITNAVVGQDIIIQGGSSTYPTSISNSGSFHLTDDMSLTIGSYIKLRVRGASDFVELERG
jgi:hypothetical protein